MMHLTLLSLVALCSTLAQAAPFANVDALLHRRHVATKDRVAPRVERRQQKTFQIAPKRITNPKLSNSGKTRVVPATTTPSPSPPAAKTKVFAGSYYTDWTGWTYTPEKVDYSKFDLIYFAFAIPDQTGRLYFTQDISTSLLSRVTNLAHAAGKQVVVSVGGWTGSTWFSTICSTAAGRTRMAKSMQTMISDFALDGIDIDWEYPGTPGAAGNKVSSADSANLLLFLRELRQLLGPNKLITMATALRPFAGTNGQPMPDISAHAALLDEVLLMAYDINQSDSSPGPNAPLSNGCGNSRQPEANAAGAIAAWSKAGMPLEKIVLGLPAYGYVSRTSATKLVPKKRNAIPRSMPTLKDQFLAHLEKRQSETPLSLVTDAASPTPTTASGTTTRQYCPDNHGGYGCDGLSPTFVAPPPPNPSIVIKAAGSGDLSQFMGQQIGFADLVQSGALVKQGDKYVGGAGYTRYWDSCSSTPYLVNTVRSTFVSYDDPESIKLKTQYAIKAGLRAAAFWSAPTDHNYALMDAARAGLGLS